MNFGRMGAVFGRMGASSGLSAPTIQLSGTTVAEDATTGTAVGVLSVTNGTGTYVFTVLVDDDSKFVLNGDGVTLETDAALDYEVATEHSVTIEANPDVGDTIAREFIITVTDVENEGVGSPVGLLLSLTQAA